MLWEIPTGSEYEAAAKKDLEVHNVASSCNSGNGRIEYGNRDVFHSTYVFDLGSLCIFWLHGMGGPGSEGSEWRHSSEDIHEAI